MNSARSLDLRRLAVMALLGFYFAMAVGYIFSAKIGTGPDERYHLAYIVSIADEHVLPVLSENDREPNIEAHQPPLYYVLQSLPCAAAISAGMDASGVNFVLRFTTAIIATCWVYVLYLLALEFFGEDRTYEAVLAAAIVSFVPMAVYIGSVVNNDSLSMLIFTTALLMILRSVKRCDTSRSTAVKIGVTIGLSMLTKAQGSVLLVVLASAGLLIARRVGQGGLKRVLPGIILSCCIALVMNSPWFVRNWIVYSNPFVTSLHNPSPFQNVRYGLEVLKYLFQYFWIPFWLVGGYIVTNTVYSVVFHALLSLVCCLAAVGTYMYVRRGRVGVDSAKRTDLQWGAWGLMLLPGVLSTLSIVLLALYVDQGVKQQGRLLLPSAGVFGLAMVDSSYVFFRRRRVRAAMATILLLGMVAANLAVIQGVYFMSTYVP